jgi:hypothetical protein
MEDDRRCIAIKSSDGQRCTYRGKVERRCKKHHDAVTEHGPNRVELMEVGYSFKGQKKALKIHFDELIEALGHQPILNNRGDEYLQINRQYNERLRLINAEQARQYNNVYERQQADIERTGINPDAVQDARRRAERQQHLARLRERQLAIEQERQERLDIRQRQIEERNVRHVQRQVDERPLANFANDRQNVHTTSAVTQTLKIVNEILKIPVPEEYKWNMRTVSKTMSEIISECNLSPASAWQMVAKYCSDETIYELVPGVYGKVLDSVWQYIKDSPDKEDLKKILTSEMRDNIGMCAQGNLSRLTNILAGYVDCIVVEESIADKLGRMLPPLMEIENIPRRLYHAARIFKEVGLPNDQWEAWAYGLLTDQEEDDYREMYIHDGIIDFIVYR